MFNLSDILRHLQIFFKHFFQNKFSFNRQFPPFSFSPCFPHHSAAFRIVSSPVYLIITESLSPVDPNGHFI